jgi:hypothetical protein
MNEMARIEGRNDPSVSNFNPVSLLAYARNQRPYMREISEIILQKDPFRSIDIGQIKIYQGNRP